MTSSAPMTFGAKWVNLSGGLRLSVVRHHEIALVVQNAGLDPELSELIGKHLHQCGVEQVIGSFTILENQAQNDSVLSERAAQAVDTFCQSAIERIGRFWQVISGGVDPAAKIIEREVGNGMSRQDASFRLLIAPDDPATASAFADAIRVLVANERGAA